jgi:hypothetical protein
VDGVFLVVGRVIASALGRSLTDRGRAVDERR